MAIGRHPAIILRMDAKNDAPSEIAKQTLLRLAKEKLKPLPENYCRTYLKVEGGDSVTSFCGYAEHLERALGDVLDAWQSPGPLLEPETARIARELARIVPLASSDEELKRIRDIGHDLGLKMKRDLENGSALHAELLAVTQLVVAAFSSFSEEDRWLHGQLRTIADSLGASMTPEALAEAKLTLQAVLERRQELQRRMADAQLVLKAIMSELIRQAASLVQNTSAYESRVAELGEHIKAANDLSSIQGVVGELDVFVREMGSSMRNAHDDISATHARLVQAERQIVDLRKDLAETSEKVRRDNLTGALNRSGLEEIWQREVRLAAANSTPLSIGLLDVDNFKQLNDRLGHIVGDEALVHLTAVIRNALHGTDTMARYGGEEFVILLPDTDAGGADAVMRRLQRELTKHFFLHDNERLLITFSAGVTVVDLETDSLISAIERADAALYEAKRQGKNRVAVG
jgi:diguanylate cyclase